MAKRRQLRGFDLKHIEGVAGLIGVDEAGRGALAGPVVAGAVLVTKEFLEGRWAVARSGRVNDSKQVSPAEREELWHEFEALAAGATAVRRVCRPRPPLRRPCGNGAWQTRRERGRQTSR